MSYIDNDEFESALYHKDLNKCCSCFALITRNLFKAYKFNLIDEEDAVNDTICKCITIIDKWENKRINKEGKKSKAFNYFTTVALNNLKALYRTEKSHLEKINKFRIQLGGNDMKLSQKKKDDEEDN